MRSSTWSPPAARSKPTTWSRSSGSWISARAWWSTRPHSSSSRNRFGASSTLLPPRWAGTDSMNWSAKPARLSTGSADFETQFKARLQWSAETDAQVEQRVTEILADVQQRGDAAVLAYTNRFDALDASSVTNLELTQAELKAAFDSLPTAQRDALRAAASRVRSYHEAQKKAGGESWSYRDEDGTVLGQKVTPLDRVGIYVPGGKAAYPSSVLMNAIPAHVAGVAQIIMVVPTPRGEKNALVLAAAYLAGVSR